MGSVAGVSGGDAGVSLGFLPINKSVVLSAILVKYVKVLEGAQYKQYPNVLLEKGHSEKLSKIFTPGLPRF